MSVYEASIDDSDPQVLYSNGWVPVTQDGDWTGTMHSTSDIGSSARVRFTGSRVAVVCTIPTGDGQLSQASFSLDNGPAVNMAHKTTPPVQWQTVFWDSGPLPLASHLLVITNTGNQAYFRLDHIDYDPTDSNAPKVSSSSSTKPAVTITPAAVSNAPTRTVVSTEFLQSSTVAILPTNNSLKSESPQSSQSTSSSFGVSVSIQTVYAPTTIDGSPTATQKSDADSASNGTEVISPVRKSPAGIIGGVVGGVVVIALLLLAVWLLRRRKKRALYLENDNGIQSASGRGGNRPGISIAPTPFSLDRRTSTEVHSSGTATGRGATLMGSPSHSHSFSPSTNMTSMYASETLPSPGSVSNNAEMSQLEYNHFGTSWRGEGSASQAPIMLSKHSEFLAHQESSNVASAQQEAPPPAYSAASDVSFSGRIRDI